MKGVSYDTIIIGMGMAGLSAAVFAARAGLKTLVIGDIKKSQLSYAREVGNYLGMDAKSGLEILEASKEQVEKYGAEALEGEVVHAGKKNSSFVVKTAGGKEFLSKTLIIASGVVFKPVGIKGEKEFLGKGVHTCVACDGIFYKGKSVAVVGNGNLAAEEALQLLSYTKQITIFSNGKEFEFTPQLKKELEKKSVSLSKEGVSEVIGENHVKGLLLKNGKLLPVSGVFLAMGRANASFFAQSLALDTDPEGFIKIDREGKTSSEGIYAAGGCTGGYEQIAKSVGEGCSAAISVIRKLKGLARYADQT